MSEKRSDIIVSHVPESNWFSLSTAKNNVIIVYLPFWSFLYESFFVIHYSCKQITSIQGDGEKQLFAKVAQYQVSIIKFIIVITW